MIGILETDLLVNGYNGKDRKFSLKEKINPYLIIKFQDKDHRILDRTIKVFCKLFNEHNVKYIGPLPNIKKNMMHIRIIKISKYVLNEVLHHMQTLELPPSVQI